MRQSKGIFWGGLLILLGMFWLLRNMGLLHIDWQEVTRYWPVLLILAGMSLLASGRERGGVGGGVAGILIALAVLGGITHRTDRAFDKHRGDWDFRWDNDDDDDWDFGNRNRDRWRNREPDRGYDDENDTEQENNNDNDADNSDKRNIRDDHYEYDMESDLREVTLNFEGGAGDFRLNGTTSKLFEADTHSSLGGFMTNIRNNRNDHTAVIDFKMENDHVKLKKGRLENRIEMNLNESPVWNIDLGVGAGKADFDFSNYKVKSLKVSTGVADMDVRLGDKVSQADVTIDSGVASVSLEVPESVGCEVHLDGALNVKNLDDLVRINDNLYRSPGFDQASRKIIIRYDAGLSKVKIRRY